MKEAASGVSILRAFFVSLWIEKFVFLMGCGLRDELRDIPWYIDKSNSLGHKRYLLRRSRIDVPGALHHIIVRGIERKIIFKDDADRDNFWNAWKISNQHIKECPASQIHTTSQPTNFRNYFYNQRYINGCVLPL